MHKTFLIILFIICPLALNARRVKKIQSSSTADKAESTSDSSSALFYSQDEYRKILEERKERQKLKKTAYKATVKPVEKMSLQELYQARESVKKVDDKAMLVKILERLLLMEKDQNKLKPLRTELGDLYFDLGKFQRAGKIYGQYVLFYPGGEDIEYASYKAILCRFYETLSYDRDQTKTEETLALIGQFKEKKEVYHTYMKDVLQIEKQCVQKLIDKEIYICNFYITKGSYKAAQNQLEHIRSKFVRSNRWLEPDLLGLEIVIAQKKGDTKLQEQKERELARRFPQKETEILAQVNKPKLYVSRF